MTIEKLFDMSLDELRALDHAGVMREFGHLLPAIRTPIDDLVNRPTKTAERKRVTASQQSEMRDMLASLQSLKASLPKSS